MKILLVSDNFLPTVGGMEQYVYKLATFLSENDHEVVVLTRTLEEKSRSECLEGLTVLRELELSVSKNPTDYYRQNLNLRKTIARHADDFDIIHYNGSNIIAFSGFKKICKIPLIVTIHGLFPVCIYDTCLTNKNEECRNPGKPMHCLRCYLSRHMWTNVLSPAILCTLFLELRLRKKGLESFDEILCLSNYAKERIRALIPADKIRVIPNFIDFEEIRPFIENRKRIDIRETLHIPNHSKVIACAGRLVPEKGIENLLLAFKIVRKKRKDVHLVLVGEGPLQHTLERKTETLDLGKWVHFKQPSRESVLRVISQCDAFVLPSLVPETCSTSLLEAMALGAPIVASNVGSNPEMLKIYKNYVLSKAGDALDFSNKILYVLSTNMRSAKAILPEVFNNFDVSKVAPKIMELLGEIKEKAQR